MMTCEFQRLCFVFLTILCCLGNHGRAHGEAFPVSISDFTAKDVDGYRIHLSWKPSSQPAGLKYTLQQEYLYHKVNYNLDEHTTTETEVKLTAYKCVPITFTLTPFVDGVQGESAVTVFEFKPENVKIKKVEHETEMHSNDEIISWRVENPSDARCKFRYSVTVNDETPLIVDKKSFILKNVVPMKMYAVRVRVLFADNTTSPARSVRFRGRYGGLYPENLRYSTEPEVGLLKLNIYKPIYSERTPVKRYHVEINLNVYGYPQKYESEGRDFEIGSYEACSDFGVKVYQETMDGTFSKRQSEYTYVNVLPHKPSKPILKCSTETSGIKLEWKRFNVDGNHLCEKSFEISWTNSLGESNQIQTNNENYYVDLTGQPSSEYTFRVAEVADGVAKSDLSEAVTCTHVERR